MWLNCVEAEAWCTELGVTNMFPATRSVNHANISLSSPCDTNSPTRIENREKIKIHCHGTKLVYHSRYIRIVTCIHVVLQVFLQLLNKNVSQMTKRGFM